MTIKIIIKITQRIQQHQTITNNNILIIRRRTISKVSWLLSLAIRGCFYEATAITHRIQQHQSMTNINKIIIIVLSNIRPRPLFQ